ncbi:MAG: DNA repair protein RecO [Blautia sp.]|nr:DNA repair protein RecO [Blautia sp.]
MSDLITVQGVVLSALPVGEYDRRIVLLTRERGKLSAFAHGARRQSSPFLAAASPFVFGTFTLYEGRSSYTVSQVEIRSHFVELASRQPGIYYGYYFLELADYFCREGVPDRDTVDLLFVTAKALLHDGIEDRLVRCIYELRLLTIQGMMPDLGGCVSCKEAADGAPVFFSAENHGLLCSACRKYDSGAVRLSPAAVSAMRFIEAAPVRNLYTFAVSEEALGEMERSICKYTQSYLDRKLKSLKILEAMI